MSHVASDYSGCQMWTDPFGIHETGSLNFFHRDIQKIRSALKGNLAGFNDFQRVTDRAARISSS
jgi:hypothetical protein